MDYEGIGTMSKSKRNGVDPQDMIERYGADTARFYVMQANPPTDTVLWSDESVEGSFRFLRRLWTIVHEHVTAGVTMPYREGELTEELKALRLKLHRAIDKVTDDYGRRMQFNTAIAAVRELLNLYTDGKYETPVARAVAQEVLENAILLLTPIVPHIATQLWRHLRPGTELIAIPWPKADPAALVQDTIELVVQVNGKLRGHIEAAAERDPRADRAGGARARSGDEVRRGPEGEEGGRGAWQAGERRCLGTSFPRRRESSQCAHAVSAGPPRSRG